MHGPARTLDYFLKRTLARYRKTVLGSLKVEANGRSQTELALAEAATASRGDKLPQLGNKPGESNITGYCFGLRV